MVRVKHHPKGGKTLPNFPGKLDDNEKEPNKVSESGITKKKRRFKPGTVALRDIRKFQKGTEMLLNKGPFVRLVREVVKEYTSNDKGIRFTKQSLIALQTAVEAEMIRLLGYTNEAAIHAKRVTIQPKDLKFAKKLLNGR